MSTATPDNGERSSSQAQDALPRQGEAESAAVADVNKRAGNDAPDPEGEALLDLLQKSEPLKPEDVPDIFSPAEQAARQQALQKEEASAPGATRGQPLAGPEPPADAAPGSKKEPEAAHRSSRQAAAAKWGQGAAASTPGLPRGEAGKVFSSGGAGSPPGGAGGAWVWLPEGMRPRESWARRHPVLFWGFWFLVLLTVFGWGRLSAEEGDLSGPKIAVIDVNGMILDASEIVTWTEKVRKDSSFIGAVLRINSPGGAVGPSQEIYAAVKRLGQTKPVVASMGSLAASGGYYAALGAREIYAGPSTLTASIGVKMQVPNMEALMKTIGISEKTLTTGKLKDAGSSWRPMNADEEQYLRGLISDMYDEFIEITARERNLPLDKVRSLADGRAMTGRQALAAQLVDKLGDGHDAIRRVKELCNVPDSEEVKIVRGPEEQTTLLKELVGVCFDAVLEYKLSAEQPLFMY